MNKTKHQKNLFIDAFFVPWFTSFYTIYALITLTTGFQGASTFARLVAVIFGILLSIRWFLSRKMFVDRIHLVMWIGIISFFIFYGIKIMNQYNTYWNVSISVTDYAGYVYGSSLMLFLVGNYTIRLGKEKILLMPYGFFWLALLATTGTFFQEISSGIYQVGIGRLGAVEPNNPITVGSLGALLVLSSISIYITPKINTKNISTSILFFSFNRYLISAILLISILFGIFIIILSGSKGPMLSGGISAIILLYLHSKKQMTLLIGLIGLFIFYFSASFNNEELIAQRVIDFSNTGDRELLINEALNIFRDNYTLGGSIFIESHLYPHNFYAEILMAAGAFGIITVYSAIIVGLLRIYKASLLNIRYLFTLSLFLFTLVQISFSGSIYYEPLLWGLLGICIGAPTQKYKTA